MKEKLKKVGQVLGAALVLFLCMTFFCTPEKAKAATYTGSCGTGVTWKYDDTTKALTITGHGVMNEFGSGNAPWYSYRAFIKSLYIGDGVTTIGMAAFQGCSALTSVRFPNDLKNIGTGAFDGCKSLTEITLPRYLTALGIGAFQSCTSLKNITFPEGLTNVSMGSFSRCSSLEEITLSSTVKSIGPSAFSGTKLTRVNVDCLCAVKVSTGNFYGATSVQTVNYVHGITEIKNQSNATSSRNGYTGDSYCKDCGTLLQMGTVIPMIGAPAGNNIKWDFDRSTGVLTISGNGATDNFFSKNAPWYSYNTRIKKIVIKEGVTGIGANAFKGCEFVTEVTLPNSLRHLDNMAFSDCKRLITLNTPYSWKKTIETGNFCGAKNIRYVNYYKTFAPCGNNVYWRYDEPTKTLYIVGEGPMGEYGTNVDFPWWMLNEEIEKIVIEKGVTSIAKYAFSWQENLKEVTIPASVISIGDYAFVDCHSLKEITIPASVTSIGNSAFSWCEALTNIDIPNRVTWIGEEAFYQCNSFGRITVPESVTYLGKNAFGSCRRLRIVDFPCKWMGKIDVNSLFGTRYIPTINYLHKGGAATCSEQAICTVCGSRYGELNRNNHCGGTVLKDKFAATCTKNGNTGNTCCKGCGKVLSYGNVIPATGHKYNPTVTRKQTSNQTGIITYKCEKCNATYTKQINLSVTATVSGSISENGSGVIDIILVNNGADLLDGWSIEFDVNIYGTLNITEGGLAGEGVKISSFKNGHVVLEDLPGGAAFKANTTKKMYFYIDNSDFKVTCTQNSDAIKAKIISWSHWNSGGLVNVLLENTGSSINGDWTTEFDINLNKVMTGTGDGFYAESDKNGHVVIRNYIGEGGFKSGAQKRFTLHYDGSLPLKVSNKVIG